MTRRLPIGFLWVSLVAFCVSTPTFATGQLTTLNLVTNDVAICLEVPDLHESWTRVESGPIMERLLTFPPYQRLLESQGFRHWQAVDDHVTKLTGSTLTSQLRILFGKSLVMAIYVPPTGEPRGILIGEANDAAAVQTAMATWRKLEPNGIVSNKSHRGQKYHQRKRDASANESVYIAISDRWFAVSDHENLIQDAIDRFLAVTNGKSGVAETNSLPQSPTFIKNRERLRGDAVAYVHINARPWDRGLDESAHGPNDPVNVAEIWKHVSAVSACLHLDGGIVCEAVVELDPARLKEGWSKFVSTAAAPSTWIPHIPADALFAIAGRLEIDPLIRLMLEQIPKQDQLELSKLRRIAQSLSGGLDLLDSVAPALARDFGGFVAERRTSDRVTLDGAIGIALDSPDRVQFLAKLDHALDFGLGSLAAYFSAEGDAVVTVERDQTDTIRTRNLSKDASLPVAYGDNGHKLVIAGSKDRLLQMLSPPTVLSNSRLDDHSSRFFYGFNQLIWFDTARTRSVLDQHGPDLARLFAHGSTDEATRISRKLEQAGPYLSLVDSVFISGRVESDHIRIVFGGGLDSNGSARRD